MAQYRPHSLPYQLKRLFDSGHCTPAGFAWQLGEKPEFVLHILKGGSVSRQVEFSFGKVLAEYRRRYPELRPDGPPIQLVTDDSEPIAEAEGTPRGIFEETESFEGKLVVKAIDDRGKCRARIEVCASDMNHSREVRLKRNLERYLDTVNPVDESVSEGTS